jgi:GT2 family glycosyltransferase
MSQADNIFSISIVLPNYNGRGLLEKNLPSLISAARKYDHEIIIVDDHSSDGSVQFLEQNYPQITIIKSPVNQGFSSTCNKGIKIACKDLACVANTDVTFTDNYFTNAMKCFTSPDIFAVKGDIINYREDFDDVINIERTCLLYYKRGFLRFNHKVEPQHTFHSSKLNTQFVLLGCCFVCRRDLLQKLKGFDEIYSPFYWEDSDLAQRALKSGYKLVYTEDCKVYHQLSATINTYRSKRHRLLVSNRNKFLFTWRHLSGKINWLIHIFYTFVNLLTRWIILDWKYYAALFRALNRHFIFTRKTNQIDDITS